MGLSDVAGVFSRYFIVGFFLPAFAALVVFSVTVSSGLIPNSYESHSSGAQIAILGASGLFVGLLLQGLSHPILRGFEGYGLLRVLEWLESPKRNSSWSPGARLSRAAYDLLLARQVANWRGLRELRREATDPQIKASAAWQLDRRYPNKRAHILPTGFGNSIRAFETYPMSRWGLDGVAATPRVGAFMSDKEHEIHSDAKADVMFFINLSLLAFALGVGWLIDWGVILTAVWYRIPIIALPILVSYAAYRGAIGAAQRWGAVVRSEVDLHRMELYEAMGVRTPSTFTEEREVIGPAVSRCILHGNKLIDELRAPPHSDNTEKEANDDRA